MSDFSEFTRYWRLRVADSKTLQRWLSGAMLAGLFLGVLMAASSGSPAGADWHEECVKEGCSSHEKQELWWSFKHECVSEGCWEEEVAELAGTDVYSTGGFVDTNVVNEMMADFRVRSQHRLDFHMLSDGYDDLVSSFGHDGTDYLIQPGYTDDFWNWLWALLEGRTVTLLDCDTDWASSLDCNPLRDS